MEQAKGLSCPAGRAFFAVAQRSKGNLGAQPLRTREGPWLGMVVGECVMCNDGLLRVWVVSGTTVLSFEGAHKRTA